MGERGVRNFPWKECLPVAFAKRVLPAGSRPFLDTLPWSFKARERKHFLQESVPHLLSSAFLSQGGLLFFFPSSRLKSALHLIRLSLDSKARKERRPYTQ